MDVAAITPRGPGRRVDLALSRQHPPSVVLCGIQSNGSVLPGSVELIADGLNGISVGTFDDSSLFGSQIASAGDLDLNGADDLLVPDAAYAHPDGERSGAIFVLYMQPSEADPSVVLSLDLITSRTAGMGGSMIVPPSCIQSAAVLGDLGGDSRVDLAIGQPADDTGGANRGAVLLLSMGGPVPSPSPSPVPLSAGVVLGAVRITDGGPGLPQVALPTDGKLGYSVAGIGDINGDSYEDIAIQAGAYKSQPSNRNVGAVFVLLMGPVSTVLAHSKIELEEDGHMANSATAASFPFGSGLGRLDQPLGH